jgi:hypothetical protein
MTGGEAFNKASGLEGAVPLNSFSKSRSSVRGVLALAAQILLPIEGLCSKLGYVPITLVARAGSACLKALKDPTTCVSPLSLHFCSQPSATEYPCSPVMLTLPICRRSVTVDISDDVATPCDSGLGKVNAGHGSPQRHPCPSRNERATVWCTRRCFQSSPMCCT